MPNEIKDKLNLKRFGQVAVEKKFVTPAQAKEALQEQIEDNLNQKPHRQLGTILLEKGWMNAQQIEVVLIETALGELNREL
jgi:hypothetical protein